MQLARLKNLLYKKCNISLKQLNEYIHCFFNDWFMFKFFSSESKCTIQSLSKLYILFYPSCLSHILKKDKTSVAVHKRKAS